MTRDIRYIKGVGEKRAALYRKVNIFTVGDLLHYFPRAYEDRSKTKPIFETIDGETVSVRATVSSAIAVRRIRKNLAIYTLQVSDGSGTMEMVWFNMHFLRDAFKVGEEYAFYGRVEQGYGKRRMSSPVYERVDGGRFVGRVVPVYPLTTGLTQKMLQTAIANALELTDGKLIDPLPSDLRKRWTLSEIHFAFRSIHFPSNEEDYQTARRRFVFEELLILQTAMAQLRLNRRRQEGIPFQQLEEDMALPFTMTGAQKRVLAEIKQDLQKAEPMNRLVQGDVGCGKTAVAACAMFLAAKNGLQSAMMAPTEILASQHYESLKQLFAPYGMEVDLLIGSLSAKTKRNVLERIALGLSHIVVGTHALLSDNVTFHQLGLVVTDEQHRFGVQQRRILSDKGRNPHVLVMTATPIPRTLSLMVYGDLDVSVIDELPPGRQKVDTFCVGEDMRERVYRFVAKHVDAGRQVYIVCPIVEESEAMNVKAVTEYAQTLQKEVFPQYTVGLLHGKMKTVDKDWVMTQFAGGKINILVATSVIEVGVNVPNAVLMVIENAERFGLSQLHQLRGRVGRGAEKSYCILFNESEIDYAKERMKVLCETNDGFRIAEKDLELRGPGEFFGTQQSGMMPLKIANIFTDVQIIGQAKQCAEEILDADPSLCKEENRYLKHKINALLHKNISFN